MTKKATNETTKRRRSEALAEFEFRPSNHLMAHTNEEWIKAYLPNFRVALVILIKNDAEFKKSVNGMIKEGIAPSVLEGLYLLRYSFRHFAKKCDAAFKRLETVMEEQGYGPENPPPDKRVRIS